jgi:ribosomal protein S12 methylthiotransferase accessory factor
VAQTTVSVTSVGEVPELPDVVSALNAVGLRATAGESTDEHTLWLVLAEDYLCKELDQLNRTLHRAGTPWLLAKAQGETLWLGPHFRPGVTGCWDCLAFRLYRNRQVEGYIRSHLGEQPRWPPATPPGAAQTVAALLARELEAIAATGGSDTLDGRMVTLRRDLGTLQHQLIRRPQCPVCGQGTDAYGGPEVKLQPAPKGHLSGGSYRSVRPEETVERLEKHISPITGAVAWVADLTEPGDSGYTNWAGHWFPVLGAVRGGAVLRQSVRGHSGGKGATPAQARASVMCESLERFSGCFFEEEPRIRTTRGELGERALPFEELVLYSDRQYETRVEWNNAQTDDLNYVGVPLEADREVDWTEAWSLTRDRGRMVPTAYCYYGHPDIADIRTFFCTGDSNGQGAGNTLEEAVTQGLMELIERDGVAIWWYNRLRVPGVDLDSFGESWIDQVRDEYSKLGREAWALDLTTELGIPVFAAVSRRLSAEPEDLIFAFGAHLEPKLALTRAFSELNQFLPAVRRTATGEYSLPDQAAIDWWTGSSLASEPYMAPDPGVPPRRLSDFADRASDDVAQDVQTCVSLLDAAGLETFVVDQSRPDIELRVAKVIVPSLRHFWRRLRHGRLYDVPVRMGRLTAPVAEDDVNPKNIWF